MQTDGNLVVYNGASVAVWSPHTHPDGNHAVMQDDGNFVVYTSASVPLWASDTGGY